MNATASRADRDIVLLSQQRLRAPSARALANANHFEAEDVLHDTGCADRLFFASEDDDPVLRIRRGAGRWLRTVRPDLTLPAIGGATVSLERDYRVAVAVVRTVWDISMLETVKQLRERVDRVVLWVFEMWPSGVVDALRHAPFHLVDLVLIGTTEDAAEQLDAVIDPPVRFMPAGIDVETFAPRSPLERSIDFLNIGRRDPDFHRSFLDRARRNDLYYVFDTTAGAHLDDQRSHRWLLAQHLRRTRVAMASAAKFDLEATGEAALRAMPNRVFEAMAAGAVLVGNPAPARWRQESQVGEVVVHELPDDCEEAVDEVERLLGHDLSEERLRNAELAIRRHDWSDRWVHLFELIGEPPPDAIVERQERVRTLRAHVQ